MEQYFLRPTTAGEPAGEGVTLVSAADPYEEIAAVAASICDDVRRRGLRYREIAVICRDLTPYRIALERTFAKYGIPFFADLPQGAMDTPAVSVVRAALDCAPRVFPPGISCALPRRQRWASPRKRPPSWKTTAMCGMWAVGTGRSPLKTIRMASRPTFPRRIPPGWSVSTGAPPGDPSAGAVPQGLREADGPAFPRRFASCWRASGQRSTSKPSAGLPNRRRSVCG